MTTETVTGYDLFTKLNHIKERNQIKEDRSFTLYHLNTNNFLVLRTSLEEVNPNKPIIFIVNRNSDFSAGNGSMLFNKAFNSLNDAYNYVMTQPGVMGSKQYHHITYGISIKNTPYAYSTFNGFSLAPVNLL